MEIENFVALKSERILEIEALLSSEPHGFGPNYRDRAAFEVLKAQPNFAKCISDAENLLTQPFPAWSDELYLDFSRTGQRPPGEKMIRARKAWLPVLLWAECLENKGRFVPTLEMVLTELAHHKSWTIPAHDSDLGNFNGRNYSVDLISAIFAHDLAQSLYMLDDKISPDVRRQCIDELQEHVFAPIRASLETGKRHGWLTSTHNWNSVCLAGVTGAALTILPDRRERAVYAAAAEHYSRYGVEGYVDDGYCVEGLGYYNYGFGSYVTLREKMWQATGGKIDLFADPKIRNIALFGPNIEIINGQSPAIGDCVFGAKVDKQILWYCSRVLGLGLKQYESLNFAKPGSPATAAMDSFPSSASQSEPAPQRADGVGLRSYFDRAGVLVCRPTEGGRFGVALQAGGNGDSHNHNDIGSFNIVLGKEQLLGDPGGPHAYTSETFGPLRYTKFQIFRSRTHPVPLVAGQEQKAGHEAAAKVLKTEFNDSTDEFVVDLAAAYDVPELKKLVRAFTYSREGSGSLVVRDDFEFGSPQDFELTMTTHGIWKQIAPDTLEIQMGSERLLAQIQAPSEVEIYAETIEENAPPFTRIGVRLKTPMQAGRVSLTFRPAP